MAEHSPRRIAHNLMAEPHVEGRRISVLQTYDYVEGPVIAGGLAVSVLRQ